MDAGPPSNSDFAAKQPARFLQAVFHLCGITAHQAPVKNRYNTNLQTTPFDSRQINFFQMKTSAIAQRKYYSFF